MKIVLLIFLVSLSAVITWIATRRQQKILSQGLGRKVTKQEIYSLSAWMQAEGDTNEKAIAQNERLAPLQRFVADSTEKVSQYLPD